MTYSKNILAVVCFTFFSSWAVASDLENAVTYGTLLTQAVKGKEEVKLKKLNEYKDIKQFLSEKECSGFKYRGYIVGAENQKFLYLVASKGKNVIIGRHFKAPINNGVIETDSFESSTNGCLNLGTPPKNVAALTVTHLKPFPNEFHVLEAQLANLALYVGTSEGIYAIEGGNIGLVQAK